ALRRAQDRLRSRSERSRNVAKPFDFGAFAPTLRANGFPSGDCSNAILSSTVRLSVARAASEAETSPSPSASAPRAYAQGERFPERRLFGREPFLNRSRRALRRAQDRLRSRSERSRNVGELLAQIAGA